MEDISIIYTNAYLDPVTLSGEGEFDLNIIKQVDVTDSFMGLPMKDKKKYWLIVDANQCPLEVS